MNQYPFYKIFGPDPLYKENYSVESVRLVDAEPIRNWRNEQISVLRQVEKLTKEQQSNYFNRIISEDFPRNKPAQILLRFCLGQNLIGYGGIVHLDWENLRGEVSFLLETSRTQDHKNYSMELAVFFDLIKRFAFTMLGLNKLSTEAYAHRQYHVLAIENSGFQREGVLREQIKISGEWVDAVVASCLIGDYLKPETK